MSLGKIRIISFSSKEICEMKITCIPCFEVSGYRTCDITTLILLNMAACNILKGQETSFHLVEHNFRLRFLRIWGRATFFVIRVKQGRRLTYFILRHSSCLTVF
jgi:hypothetical protein